MIPKFKVGDRVRCINVHGHSDKKVEIHGYGWELGKEFIINVISNIEWERGRNSLDIPIYWALGRNGVYEHALELVAAIKKEVKVYGIVKFMEKINAK